MSSSARLNSFRATLSGFMRPVTLKIVVAKLAAMPNVNYFLGDFFSTK
jgi:hypothetical protein